MTEDMCASEAPSSPASDRASSPTILTPSRKVKDLLARFDDSDSDNELTCLRTVTAPVLLDGFQTGPSTATSPQKEYGSNASDHGDDDKPMYTAPRGRLAARMQAKTIVEVDPTSEDGDSGNAYNRIKHQMQQIEKSIPSDGKTTGAKAQSSSEDELAGPGLRRRLLKRKLSPVARKPQHDASPRSPSPLFFPSPSTARRSSNSLRSAGSSDKEDLPESSLTGINSRFLDLVEKHRKQRLAKEAADIVKRAERVKQLQSLSKNSGRLRGSSPADGSDEGSDDEAAKRMSTQSRPTRKASKKAVEEMNRETQRMTRNMQLAHQAKTKKKITKESLLARFNFPLPTPTSTKTGDELDNSATASSAPNSDTEVPTKIDTPPTSPSLPFESINKDMSILDLPQAEVFETVATTFDPDEGLPSMEDILTQPAKFLDKGKGKATDLQPSETLRPSATKVRQEPRPLRVKWSKEDAVMARAADSDSDLEIVTSNSRKIAAFESLPKGKAREKHSHFVLRSLAHMNDNTKKKVSSVSNAQMEANLRKAARMQAKQERQDKIEELKAKGVVIQSAEERERDQQEVEDLVERARQEASEIQRREQAKAKKDGTFVKDSLDDDDSDDEEDGDFRDEGEGPVRNISEDEEEGDEADVEDDTDDETEEDGEEGGMALDDASGGLIDQEVDDAGSDESEEDDVDNDEILASGDEDAMVESAPVVRKPRISRVLSDEEDEEMTMSLPAPPKTPRSVPRSARKIIPGLQMSDDLPMGLTQAFAATMAESQDEDDDAQTQEQDSLDFTRELPSPRFPLMPNLHRLDSLDMVTDSQPASQTQPLSLDLSFSQSQLVPESPAAITSTQFSQMPFELTQDVGFVLSPFAENRFDTPRRTDVPRSTIDTVIMSEAGDGSPVVQRKSRLRRGRAASVPEDAANEEGKDSSVFDVMRRAAIHKEAEPLFDKSKSHARDIVDEAAEESEDEYAGLGGASDEEAGEEDEEDRRMIDHDEKIGRGDEAKLAGLYADNERKQDEAAVSKLLKDITTGGLRRKRGVGDDLDLSDEEDEASRRREAKRREFARMRRELLKDEAVGKIAEDKKKDAFLKSIEDREADDDDDELSFDEQDTQEDESQSQLPVQNETVASTSVESEAAETLGNKRKRPLEPSTADTTNRLPPALRRIRAKAVTVNRKPSTLAEIRESVSFLVEEPDSQTATPQYTSSDDEDQDPEAYVNLDRHIQTADENEEDDNGEDLGDFIVDDSQEHIFKKPQLPTPRAPFAERRTKANVVDRRSMIRQASSSSSMSATSKMAFLTSNSGSSDNFAFKGPSLLRRATTNSSFGSNVSATGVTVSTERGAPDQEKDVIRKGAGGRRNAVNYRVKPKEEQMKSRVAVTKGKTTKGGKGGFLGGLFRGDSWS